MTRGQFGTTADGLGLDAGAGRMANRAYGANRGALPKVLLVVLCQDELFRTDGTGTWLPTVYEPAELRTLGPMIKQLRVHYVAEAATSSNFRARVTLAWSVLARSWSTPDPILATTAGTQTGTIGSWYTTDGNFGLFLRGSVEVSNASGAALESARLTVILEIELKS
jgi:hypothetical protein